MIIKEEYKVQTSQRICFFWLYLVPKQCREKACLFQALTSLVLKHPVAMGCSMCSWLMFISLALHSSEHQRILTQNITASQNMQELLHIHSTAAGSWHRVEQPCRNPQQYFTPAQESSKTNPCSDMRWGICHRMGSAMLFYQDVIWVSDLSRTLVHWVRKYFISWLLSQREQLQLPHGFWKWFVMLQNKGKMCFLQEPVDILTELTCTAVILQQPGNWKYH